MFKTTVWTLVFLAGAAQLCWAEPHRLVHNERAAQLAEEVRNKGWVVYSAKIGTDNWDLFIMRPDGSERKNITNTPRLNEAAARFSPNGRKILYYRMPKGTAVDNNKYGTYELVIADSDGTNAVCYGSQYQWASWGPGGKRLACLSIKGIQVIDLATKEVVSRTGRRGIVEQLVWSPDGKWFAGTANGLGQYWTIGRVNAVTGEVNAVSEINRYNCTPDWLPDSQHIVYARGIVPEVGGWAQLWSASGDGRQKRLLYAEEGRHIYGGGVSPDNKYVLFTRSREDLGTVDNSRTTMALMRLRDAPIVRGNSDVPDKSGSNVRNGPVLDLSSGWEPHWTYAKIGEKK